MLTSLKGIDDQGTFFHYAVTANPNWPEPNKEELAFRALLQGLTARKVISSFETQPFIIQIGVGCTYTPDFFVYHQDGTIEAIEYKGFLRDDALTKFKVAAMMYPEIVWHMVQKKTKKQGGGYKTLYLYHHGKKIKHSKTTLD